MWPTVLDVVDAVESWIAGQSYWVQVVILLAVLGPLCYLLAGLIDRAVEAVLAWHSRRDAAPATAEPVHAPGAAVSERSERTINAAAAPPGPGSVRSGPAGRRR